MQLTAKIYKSQLSRLPEDIKRYCVIRDNNDTATLLADGSYDVGEVEYLLSEFNIQPQDLTILAT